MTPEAQNPDSETNPSSVPEPPTAQQPVVGQGSPEPVLSVVMNPAIERDSSDDDSPTVVLPMQLVQLDDVGRTDVGRQRNHNEDNFAIRTTVQRVETAQGRQVKARGLYILCDGMGGHASGEVASANAIKFLADFFKDAWDDELPSRDIITQSILEANQRLYDINQDNSSLGSGRMGTTLVMLLLRNTKVAIAHVGDSRIYRYTRKGGLEQVTVDHEVGQLEIQRGVDPDVAYSRSDAFQLTQALGPRDCDYVAPDVTLLEINEDTLFLLCSDGLSDNDLLEEYCESHVKPLLSSRTNLDAGISELVELANDYNGHDNITLIAVRAKVKPDLATLR
ncbi:MAG: serine/threonine phosphatase [Cyanobacteria bacterium P01_H01_bin.121]